MPSTTSFKVGDIVSVNFPYSDLQGYKRRPGLVLHFDQQDLLLARITTQPASSRAPFEFPRVSGHLSRRGATFENGRGQVRGGQVPRMRDAGISGFKPTTGLQCYSLRLQWN
jgi:hypothetical protein